MNEEKPRDVGNKSAIVENYSLDDLVDEFKDLDPDLRKQLDRRGLEDSLDLLTRLEEIIEEIRDEFTRIDDAHEADVKRNPAATDSIDLAAATRALAVVRNGLSELLIESHSLNRLFNGLQDLHTGASPAGMFLGLESNSRRPDASNIQSAKGIIAAIIQAKQKVGRLSRQEAAKWTLKNLSVSLRERISV